MRAIVQGLDGRASWERYLATEGDGTDLRLVRATIQRMRDEFAAAALRERRPGTARLVLIDANALADDPSAPSLDAFVTAHGLEDLRENEQLEAYEEAHGRAATRHGRKDRLIRRQLDALHWLERLVAQPPRANDGVGAWLAPALARRLDQAGLATLGQLVDHINGVGLRWSAAVPAIGAAKALRVVEWLREHETSLGMTIGAHVGVPRRRLSAQQLAAVVAEATAIRPIEKLLLPPDFDGSRGTNRCPSVECRLGIDTDREALKAWIATKGPSPGVLEAPGGLNHTQRAYRKEAERWLLWMVIVRRRPLSSATAEDAAAYLSFLADPQPRVAWCGPRYRERWSPLWRPFEGALSPAAQRHAAKVLRALHAHLVDGRYLVVNPWATVLSASPSKATERLSTETVDNSVDNRS